MLITFFFSIVINKQFADYGTCGHIYCRIHIITHVIFMQRIRVRQHRKLLSLEYNVFLIRVTEEMIIEIYVFNTCAKS